MSNSLDVVSGIQVVDSSLSVDFESVLVHLDIDGSPLFLHKVSIQPHQYIIHKHTKIIWLVGDTTKPDHTTHPDIILARVFIYNTLIFRRSTSLLSGEIDQSTR